MNELWVLFFFQKEALEWIYMNGSTYRDCIYYVVQNPSMLVNLDFIHWLTNWKHQLWLAKSYENKELLCNFYTHSVKSDVKSVAIFLILLNKVGQIDNRCKDRKLRPCKGSVRVTHIRRGARMYGDVGS